MQTVPQETPVQVKSWASIIAVTFKLKGQPERPPEIRGRAKEAGCYCSGRSYEEASSDCECVG